MIYLVAGILVFEIIRLIIQIQDSKRVNKLNAHISERLEARYNETDAIRRAEIEELKELAKGSKILEGFVNELRVKK
jgi:hypothetical protein